MLRDTIEFFLVNENFLYITKEQFKYKQKPSDLLSEHIKRTKQKTETKNGHIA